VRISVVVPVKNQARWLDAALGSVLGQEAEVEAIVLDGGSTDGTLDVIRRHGPRLAWWRSGPDAGQTAALNEGFRRATGDAMGWLNADDLLLPGALARVRRAFDDPAVGATCGWSVTIDADGRRVGAQVYPQPTRETLLLRPRLAQETVYWRRSVWERLGPLDEGLHLCMDREYWLRMAKAGIVPRLLRAFVAAYRVHAEQKGRLRPDAARAEEREILRRIHGEDADAESLRKRLPVGWRFRKRMLRNALRLGLLRVPPVPSP
jgi:glycosyltransferase involved in cell wall biosynthesis